MRAHNRRSGASVGCRAIAGLILNLFGSTTASAHGHLPGRDPQGGWRLVCSAKECNEPPISVRNLPDDNSPIWDCPSCGGLRTAERLPSDSGTEP
jgi:hypothetical protein